MPPRVSSGAGLRRNVTSHDQLFKQLFQIFLTDLLSLAEPEALLFLDTRQLRFLNPETYTHWPEGERRQVDLLAFAPTRGSGEDQFLVHVEVERNARSAMGHRLWCYANLLQGRHGVPVLTILVNLRGGIAGVTREAVRKETSYREVSVFHYTAFSLSGCRAEEYLDRPEPLAWGLASLMRPAALSRAQLKAECHRRILRAALDPHPKGVLVNCVQTYLQLDDEGRSEYEALCALDAYREVQKMELTWADQMREEGRVQGVQRGRLEGARQVLLQLLAQRFAPLPERVRRQVEKIDSLDRLTQLSEQILTAQSLQEMGLGQGR